MDAEPVLRVYAIVLSLCHTLTGVAWFRYKHVASLLSGEDAVCWPFFASCWELRPHLSESTVTGAVVSYMALGAGAAALFAKRRTREALAAFVLACALGVAIYALDYRMRLNQSYMFGWTALVFLFSRHKLAALQLLIVLFYFWAGTLKLNAEWLSGAALYAKPWLVPEAMVPAASAYVLVLELVLVFGLLSRRAIVRWATYAQLLVFHLVSFGVVGFFYPVLMFGLTAIYPLVWRRANGALLSPAAIRAAPVATRRELGAIAALFSGLQLVPYLYPGEAARTGEGRLFALHMFDAKVTCEGRAELASSAGARSTVTLVNPNLDPRTRCDPIVIHAAATRLCRMLEGRPDRVRVDVVLDAKRAHEDAMRPLVRGHDFCAPPPAYRVFGHNPWIVAE